MARTTRAVMLVVLVLPAFADVVRAQATDATSQPPPTAAGRVAPAASTPSSQAEAAPLTPAAAAALNARRANPPATTTQPVVSQPASGDVVATPYGSASSGAAPPPNEPVPSRGGPSTLPSHFYPRGYYETGGDDDARLLELQKERAGLSLGPPIILLSAGGVVAITGFYLVLLEGVSDGLCEGSCTNNTRNNGRAWGITLVGGVGAAAGLVWLISRARERRRLGREIKELRARSGFAFTHHFDAGPHGGSLGFTLRF